MPPDRLATTSGHARIAPIDRALVAAKAADARANARGREIHILHDGDADPVQRMLNALQPGTYIRPHRHLRPAKSESFVVLAGALGVVTFRDDGTPELEASISASPLRGIFGADLRSGLWHSVFSLEPDTVVFEVKGGPYSATDDKEFAPWAPAPTDPASRPWLATLEDAFRRHHSLPPRNWTP